MKTILGLSLVLVSLNAFANITNQLPKTEPLAKVSKAIRTLLGDGNISTGTTSIWAGQMKKAGVYTSFKNKKDFSAFMADAFAETFKDERDQALPADAKLDITVGKFVDGDTKSGTVYGMTTALMESNAYSTSNEVRAEQSRYLWALLRKLPVGKDTLVGHVKTKLMDDSSEEMRTVEYFLLLNKDGKAVQFFTIEGTM